MSKLDAKLELAAEMLETARKIVAELECAESAEKLGDVNAGISNARDFARELLKMKVEAAS